MYFFILNPDNKKINVVPGPSGSHILTAHIVFEYEEKLERFRIIKHRSEEVYNHYTNIHLYAEKHLGIRLFDDGFFVSDKEKMLFLLKYQGLTSQKVVDFPLI